MGQRNQIKRMSSASYSKLTANDLVEFLQWDKLGNRQLADRNNQIRLQDIQFTFKPNRAITYFLRRRHPITARWIFTGKTAAHCSHIYRSAELLFAHSRGCTKPAKKSLTCGPGKRPSQLRLLIPGRLAHQQNFACHRLTTNHRWMHSPALPALPQFFNMRNKFFSNIFII